jgi:hypothetical protein
MLVETEEMELKKILHKFLEFTNFKIIKET